MQRGASSSAALMVHRQRPTKLQRITDDVRRSSNTARRVWRSSIATTARLHCSASYASGGPALLRCNTDGAPNSFKATSLKLQRPSSAACRGHCRSAGDAPLQLREATRDAQLAAPTPCADGPSRSSSSDSHGTRWSASKLLLIRRSAAVLPCSSNNSAMEEKGERCHGSGQHDRPQPWQWEVEGREYLQEGLDSRGR